MGRVGWCATCPVSTCQLLGLCRDQAAWKSPSTGLCTAKGLCACLVEERAKPGIPFFPHLPTTGCHRHGRPPCNPLLAWQQGGETPFSG